MDTYNCVNYNTPVLDFLLPSYKIIYKLCVSTDKTKLFLVSLMRLFFWIMIFTFLTDNKYIGRDNKFVLYILLIAYIIINIIYIMLIIFKTPAIDKSVIDKISTNIAKEIKTIPVTQQKFI